MERAPRTARDLMTDAPYTFLPEVPVSDAAGRLIRERHSGAPVVDADGRLLGVISELDMMRALRCVENAEEPTGTVGEWMTRCPMVVSPEASVYDLVDFFERTPIRRAPVVEHQRVVGIVSRHDALRALVSLAHECHRARADEQPFEP